MGNSNDDLQALVADLTCTDVIKCQNARRRLVQIGESAVKCLEEALLDKNHWVHWEAAKALAEIGSPTATKALIQALEHREFDQRWIAAEGLTSIGRPALIPLLERLIDRPQSLWLQQSAHHVMSDTKSDELHQIVGPVIEAIEGPEPSVEVPLTARKAIEILRQGTP